MRSEHFPKRVVSLQPSVTVTLERLGLLDCVIACTKYCADVCPELRQLDPVIVSDSWSAQAKQFIDLRADLIIASVPYQVAAVAEILKAGIRFLGLAPRSISDVYTDTMAIAGIMGEGQGGAALVSEMKAAIEQVRSKSAGATRPRVYCEAWGKPLIHSERWVQELVEAAGGEFIGEAGKPTTKEAVRELAPEVIVAAWCGAGDRVPLEKIVVERQWQETPAVRAGRVYCVADELLNTPAITLLGGLKALAWAIHPELFPLPSGIRCIEVVVK